MNKLSIIVPCYNAENHLENCIRMISRQTFKDYELLLINDGSTDKTLKIAEDYATRDSRIKVLDKKNSGVGETRNYGIMESKGEYIMFVDCDDYFTDDWLEFMLKTIDTDNYDLVICNHQDMLIYKNGAVRYITTSIDDKVISSQKQFHNEFIRLRKLCVSDILWNKIYKADIIKENNILFTNIRRGEDVVFNLDYNSHVEKCKLVNYPCYKYRIEVENPSWKKYSENYYYLVQDEYKLVCNQLIKWGVFNTEAQIYQANYLMIGFIGQIKSLISFKKLTTNEVRLYIHKINEETLFKEGLERCKFDYSLSYLVIELIKKKWYRLAILTVKCGNKAIYLRNLIISHLLYDEKIQKLKS